MSSLSTPLNHSPHVPRQPPKPADFAPLDQDHYAQMFKQLDHESLATLVTAVLITLFFWLAIFLTCDSSSKFLHMPLWFVLSCLGGYIISVAGVIVLVKYFLKDLPLHPQLLQANSSSLDAPTEQAKAPTTLATAPNVTDAATSTAEPLLKANSSTSSH